jgi:hypothetical protein
MEDSCIKVFHDRYSNGRRTEAVVFTEQTKLLQTTALLVLSNKANKKNSEKNDRVILIEYKPVLLITQAVQRKGE